MPCVSQTVLPLQQPRLAGPATPYQQAVQPPKKPAGRGVAVDAPTDKTTPVGDIPDRGRLSTRGWGGGSQSISCPRGAPGRLVRSHRVRWMICPPGRHPPVSHHHQHLKEPSLGGEVGQGLPSVIPRGWQQTFVAVDGGRTWSISSGSTTNTVSTPLQSRNGRGSRSGSLTTPFSIKWKLWPLRKPSRWTLWPTSRTSSIRHRPPLGWPRDLHRVDQEGELLSQDSSSTGPPP